MSDLRCTKCEMTATYADAHEADVRKTCGSEIVGADKHVGGEKHDWIET